MKANEALEKIYISVVPSEFGGNETITCGKDFPNAVEYTRTDAFIEKVYKWLNTYAFVGDDKNVHLPTLLHDFIKDSRKF